MQKIKKKLKNSQPHTLPFVGCHNSLLLPFFLLLFPFYFLFLFLNTNPIFFIHFFSLSRIFQVSCHNSLLLPFFLFPFIFYFYSWTQIQFFLSTFSLYLGVFKLDFLIFFHSLLNFWCNLIINVYKFWSILKQSIFFVKIFIQYIRKIEVSIFLWLSIFLF